jgi:Ser/Thr protein kinase RdoA (MazF antagonist)
MQFNPPRICPSLLLRETENQFGLTGDLKPLEGEREQNHLLTLSDGRAFVLKVSSATEDPARVDFLIRALRHLARVAPHLPVSRVVPRLDGEYAGEIVGPTGERHLMRLVTYMPDVLYAEGQLPTLVGIREMGRIGGSLCRAFHGYSHPAARGFMPWDLSNGLLGSEELWRHGNEDIRRYEETLRPLFKRLFDEDTRDLEQQVTHYDLHPMNLLRADHTSVAVTGVIDFSDMTEGPVVCDLAILAWGFIGCDDPIEAIAAVVTGYNEDQRLTAREIMMLYNLILARAVQMVLLIDFRLKSTDDPPAFTRDRSDCMANTLRWLDVDRSELGARLLSACEMTGTS